MAQVDELATQLNKLKELKELKRLLRKSVTKYDPKSFQTNVEDFYEKFKFVLKPRERAEVKKMLENLRKIEKPSATYYEFILFLIVIIIMIWIFGEGFIKIMNDLFQNFSKQSIC